jgi:hypothetical protein
MDFRRAWPSYSMGRLLAVLCDLTINLLGPIIASLHLQPPSAVSLENNFFKKIFFLNPNFCLFWYLYKMRYIDLKMMQSLQFAILIDQSP